jgi:hypothetical protein
MLRKAMSMFVLATAVALGGTALSTAALARGGGGGGHGGGFGGGHFGGFGGGHMAGHFGGFHGGQAWRISPRFRRLRLFAPLSPVKIGESSRTMRFASERGHMNADANAHH